MKRVDWFYSPYPWIDLLNYCIQGFEKTKKLKNILKQKHLVFLVILVGERFSLLKWRQFALISVIIFIIFMSDVR